MDTSLDLVDHFKLEVEQLPEYTQHTHYKSDRSHGLRRLKVVKRWRRKHEIGDGASGIVWLEVEEDGSERAVKAISRRLCSSNKIDYRKELAAMAILSKYQELFVAFHGWFEGPDHIFVAMEYFKHGDLQRHMDTKMPEIQAKIVIAQVLEGLKTMHQLGFTHRDLKPQNIFVVDTDPFFWVKIGDFGITKRILNEQTFLRTEIGTPDYLAPEVLGYVEEETSRYTNAVDLWSLGCICHRLLTLESPFPKLIALRRYCQGMTKLPIEVLYKNTVSEEAITLVKDLMNIQPSERIDAEAALHSLWLKDVESLDSAFTVQSESNLPLSVDKVVRVHDAGLPQDNRDRETQVVTMKKRREAWYLETPLTTDGHIPVASAPAISEMMISGPDPDGTWDRPKLQRDTEIPAFEPIETLQELPDNALSGGECLAARFRMAGHYPHVLALADYAFRWAAEQDSKDLMVYVLENGAPIDINALLGSLEVRGNSEAIVLLETKRNATDPWHTVTKPLHTACFYGQVGVVNDVLDHAGSWNISKILRSRDYRGETALHKAIGGRGGSKNGHRVELVQRLLSLGADPIQRDMRGRTALFLARDLDYNEMIPALKAASKGLKYPVSILEEAFAELEVMETPADHNRASSSDDDEVSSLKSEVSFAELSFGEGSFGNETGNGSNKAEKVDGPKQSWWRSLLSPEAHLKSRKRMGTDRLGGDHTSRREDDLHKAALEGRLGAKYLTYDRSTGGVKTVIMRPE